LIISLFSLGGKSEFSSNNKIPPRDAKKRNRSSLLKQACRGLCKLFQTQGW
jgi:hypothetical protein